MILIPLRNNTSNETNAGNSMGKLCFFFTFVLTEFSFCSLYAIQYVFEHRGQGTLIVYLIRLLPFLMGRRWAGLQKNDGWNGERAHKKKCLLLKIFFFFGKSSNLFAKAAEFVSELVNKPLQTVMGTLYLEFIQLTQTFAVGLCSSSPYFWKENKCGNNNLLCNACLLLSFFNFF